jgi:transcriptional regulator with XRE-family HTH domain/quercetin dioxygenase-like cupin family protein
MSETIPDTSQPDAPERDDTTPAVGQRLRSERERRRIGLRELARRVNVSPSLISQIELGRATPSVGTLYAIVSELNLSLDELFFEVQGSAQVAELPRGSGARQADAADEHDASHPPSRPVRGVPPVPIPDSGPVVRTSERQSIHLGSGVTWERMSPPTDHGVDFLYVVYEVGGASAPERGLIRHTGREYGHLLEGSLCVTVGFETYTLVPGDAIAFDSSTPHRLFNAGDVPAKALWFVVGRDDTRVTRNENGE